MIWSGVSGTFGFGISVLLIGVIRGFGSCIWGIVVEGVWGSVDPWDESFEFSS